MALTEREMELGHARQFCTKGKSCLKCCRDLRIPVLASPFVSAWLDW